MKLKNFWHILLLCVIGAGFVSCKAEKDSDEKVLNLTVSAKVKGMDPIYSNDLYSSNEIARVYEGLLEYHYLKRPYELTPNLAASMPKISDDGKTYTFKLKKGVYFHDDEAFEKGKGREVIAQDFVYSLKRLADPKLQATGWWTLDGKIQGLNEWREKYGDRDEVDYSEEIEGLKALDKYTLQFKLTKPYPQFLYTLAMPFTFVVAEEVVERHGKEFLNHPVGTGPFMLDEFDQGNKIVYKKNPNFRKKLFPSEASDEFKKYLDHAGEKLPFADKIIVEIIREDQPRWLNFQRGNLDFIAIPKDNFETAITPGKGLTDQFKKKGIELDITPSLDVTYTAFNHDKELFQNVNLRRAMMAAYNLPKANELFFNGTAIAAQSVVPPGIAGHMKDYKNPYIGPDVEKAKELLKKAGYPGGQGLRTITYDTAASTVSRQMGEFFKKRMDEIGINIRVRQNPWPELQKKITNRQVDLYGIAWGADYPDAQNFLQLLYGPNSSPGPNGAGYDNEKFNKMYKKATTMQPGSERAALYEKMNKYVAEQVPWIFGVHRQNYVLRQGWLENFVNSDFSAGRAQYLDVDKKKKKELMKKF